MQTVSPRLKRFSVDRLLLSINLLLIVAFNLSLYFLFVRNDPGWFRAVWCLTVLLMFWILLWSLRFRDTSQKNDATTQVGGTLLTLVTVYSLLNGLSYLWLPDLEVYVTVILQGGITLIVGITMTLSLVDQSQADSQINWPVVICSYLTLVVTLMLNLTGVWLMLTGGV
ncbi:hypothetical protein [Gimesia maris]|uniref:Uncharacterized protein n=1 Tax=Gimesia maris TaxID=122 RepID=A0ABX5YZT0_9PLAN|nr:hypothetical protein [Gimesia maris]EDL61024.1 chloride channel protein [Gimesia maris DSM 8797]QEG20049.1 hypothetical protein GmarT_59580 [Gimesia maris]QGQ32472.1 hypothetical protein F1729_29610 [Gimesia maris]